jgi:hypothetical protein
MTSRRDNKQAPDKKKRQPKKAELRIETLKDLDTKKDDSVKGGAAPLRGQCRAS